MSADGADRPARTYGYRWWVVRPREAVIGPFDSEREADEFRRTGLATWARRDAVTRQAVERPTGDY